MKTLLSVLVMAFGLTSVAQAQTVSTPALFGYDPVAYFDVNKAERGSGFHTSDYNGKSYLFTSKARKAKFDANPEKYLPEFGGWCAYGLSVGKKFYSDPTVFEIVGGKLYLNLDKGIQKNWRKDKKINIKKGHSNWAKVANKNRTEL